MNYTDLTAYRKSNPFMDFCGIEAVRAEHDDCEVKRPSPPPTKTPMALSTAACCSRLPTV